MFPLRRRAASWIFLVLSLVSLIKGGTNTETRVVCYYTNWSVYRPGTAKFNPQNINPYLCTHLIYAFGGFTKDNTLKPFDKYQDIEQGGYSKFTGLKTYNKNLKTLLAIGGWNEGSSRFSALVASPERRQQFIRNTLKFLRQNHFDGLDLDWEYPAHREGGKARDKDNYAQFVQELREEFNRESSKTGRPRLLLTMAVPAGVEYVEKGYDIPKLNKYLDWFNLLTYDYHSSYEPSVNHHSPLYPLEEASEYNYDGDLNIDYSVKFYLNAGADREKLVLGIPTYGRSYTLLSEDATDIGSPSDGPGAQGEATREKGYLSYFEICQNVREDPDWTVVQPNEKAMGPYAFKDNQWVGYDDEEIARKKGEYVIENGLGGIMFWSIDNDDFRGLCNGKPYPIIEAAKEAMYNSIDFDDNEIVTPASRQKPNRSRSRQGSSSSSVNILDVEQTNDRQRPSSGSRRRITAKTTTTTKPTQRSRRVTTTTPKPPTTPDPGADFKCIDEGFFPHPRDCKKYFWCLDSGPSNLGIVAHQFTCPSGLYFNKDTDSCDYTRNVLCQQTTAVDASAASITTTTTTTGKPHISINRKTIHRTATSTTSTTTTEEPIIDDEEYGAYDDEDYKTVLQEEDPVVIKELIDLIKKLGGLEELEKQLHIQEDGSALLKDSKTNSITTTPSTISKELYKKVLSGANRNQNRFSFDKTTRSYKYDGVDDVIDDDDDDEAINNTANSSDIDDVGNTGTTIKKTQKLNSRYSSIVRGGGADKINEQIITNSRFKPQNDGVSELEEVQVLVRKRPQYTTINRGRPLAQLNVEKGQEQDVTEIDEEQFDRRKDDVTDGATTIFPQYVNIRRQQPTSTVARISDIEEDPIHTTSATFKSSEGTEGYSTKMHYVNINRIRTTTESTISEPSVSETSVSSFDQEIHTNEFNGNEDETNKVQYVSLTRDKPTILRTTENPDLLESSSVDVKGDDDSFVTTSRYKVIDRKRPTTPTITIEDDPTTVSVVEEELQPEIISVSSNDNNNKQFTENISETIISTKSYTQTPTQRITTEQQSITTISNSEPITLSEHQNLTENQHEETISQNIIKDAQNVNSFTTLQTTVLLNDNLIDPITITETVVPTTLSIAKSTTVSSGEDITDKNDTNDLTTIKNLTKLVNTQTTIDSLSTSNINRSNNSNSSISTSNKSTIEFLGTVSSPRPFGFSRRTRPTTTATPATTTTTTQPPSTTEHKFVRNKIRPVFRPNFRRPINNNIRKTPSTTFSNNNENSDLTDELNSSSTIIILPPPTVTPVSSSFGLPINNRRRSTRPTRLTSTTTPATTITSYDNINNTGNQVPTKFTRRSYLRPTFSSNDRRRINAISSTTTTVRSLTINDSQLSSTEQPNTSVQQRTVNPLFRRRFTSPKRVTPTTPLTTQTITVNTISPILENDLKLDQEIESSVQDSKFTENRYNQIGETINVDDGAFVEAITKISKAPLPLRKSTINKNIITDNLTKENSENRNIEEAIFIENISTPRKSLIRRKPIKVTTPITPSSTLSQYLVLTTSRTIDDEPPKTDFLKRGSRKPQFALPKEQRKQRLQFDTEEFKGRTYRPVNDYDYYDDGDVRIVGTKNTKVILHDADIIECLDQGNFPHPLSCRKFISCAKMETGGVVGWEYTCPKGLSYDPVGGICNWAAGLGCKD